MLPLKGAHECALFRSIRQVKGLVEAGSCLGTGRGCPALGKAIHSKVHAGNGGLCFATPLSTGLPFGQSNIYMRPEPTLHVPPGKLWQSVCGALELPQSDYEHVIGCPACEKLITEIAEALDDIASQWPTSGATAS